MVITYNTTGSLPLAEDTIYLNNWQSGEYLGYYDGELATKSGLIDSYGARIKWILRKVDGGYVVRPSFSSTTYLAVPVDTSSVNVEGVSIIDKTIPDRCIWEISVVESGKITLKNKYNGKYLFDNGTYLNTSSTLDTAGEEVYRKRVWRYVSASKYKSANGDTYSELDSGFFVNTCSTFSGKTIKPTVKSERTNLLWSDASDFTYTGYNSSQISYNSLTGTFTSLSSSSSMYSTQVTATHKVSGRSKTFTLVVNPKAQFVVVKPSDGRDRTSWINSSKNYLTAQGISSVDTTYDSYTKDEIIEKLDNDNNYIFISRSHGYINGTRNHEYEDSRRDTYSGIIEYGLIIAEKSVDGLSQNVIIREDDIPNDIDLSNMGLVVFAACRTTSSEMNRVSLPQKVVNRGARAAIGFKYEVYNIDSNKWVEQFTECLSNGYTIGDARSAADSFNGYYKSELCKTQGYGDTNWKLGE